MADTTHTSNLGTGTDPASREASTTKAVIRNVDMEEQMQADTIDIAVAALQEHPIEKDIAAKVKRDMDAKFTPTWHVVVGKNFGSFVTYEVKHFIYFYIDKMAFLIWKS
ncbi:putative dynein light chain 1, cytoplasmic [Clavulina sp. PMI_390]|nr:putative dynein light chain 1, cytoplasmic [Clavulina sp. PMI_390]